jgi:hypothetical protein
MNTISCTLAAAVLFTLVGQLNVATAANLHCTPKEVIVTNKKSASIKVLNFKYKVEGSDKVHTEGLGNKRLAPDEREEWKNQRLNHAATGVVVTETAIEYKNDNSGDGDGYGKPEMSKWFPRTYKCGSNHTYPHDIE